MKCTQCAKLRAQIKRLESENSHLRAGGEAAIEILSFRHGALLETEEIFVQKDLQAKPTPANRGRHELHGLQ